MSKNIFKRILTSLMLLILLLITIFSYNIVFILSLFILCCIVCFEANSIFEKIVNKNNLKIHKKKMIKKNSILNFYF